MAVFIYYSIGIDLHLNIGRRFAVNFHVLSADAGNRTRIIEETGRFVVKVADSCPLAIEVQR
jgi:hypothetical protein